MPQAALKAAFNNGQRIVIELRCIHARELAVIEMLAKPNDKEGTRRLQAELTQLRSDWFGLFDQYTTEVSRYIEAVDRCLNLVSSPC